MGNLAVKCENQWQEKKEVAGCAVRGTLEVRVMKSDGSGIEDYKRPVVAAEVMHQFPDYVVVQWCPKKNVKLGKRGQLKVLQRHEVLTPGQTYILFPIPADLAKNRTTGTTARRSRRMQSAKDRLSILLQRSELGTASKASLQPLGDEKISENGKSDDEKAKQPSLFPGFKAQGSQNSSGNSQERDGVSATVEERKGWVPNFNLSSWFQLKDSSWRPALLSIPESPIGFHSRPSSRPPSRPDSPMTPVAFRIVSNRDQPGQ